MQKNYYCYCYCHHHRLALEIIMGGSLSSGTTCWMYFHSICNHYYKPNNILPCISSCWAHNTFRHMLRNQSVPKFYSLNLPTVKPIHHPLSVHCLHCQYCDSTIVHYRYRNCKSLSWQSINHHYRSALLHSSTNRELIDKHICDQSSHYVKYG